MFFKEQLVNVCVGSVALLGFEVMEQAITEINLRDGTFTFLDRQDCASEQDMGVAMVESGLLFPHVKLSPEHSQCHLWHLANGVALNTERKLVCISGQDIVTEFLGKSLSPAQTF